MKNLSVLMRCAHEKRTVIPAFNIPHLPMVEPVISALKTCEVFGLIEVARLEWEKFQSQSLRAVKEEYSRFKDDKYTALHLDHIPVIDEDGQRVDYVSIISEALEAGYESVMVDGSRLCLQENINATCKVVKLARKYGAAVEAELGAVAGHEDGPMPDYEDLFASGKGFTDTDEVKKFVEQTSVDWLSVSFGNVHGAISKAKRGEKKVIAILNIDHLAKLQSAAKIPLVLHGGSGIDPSCIREAVRNGISKINIGTTIRQAYENNINKGNLQAGQAVYDSVCDLLKNGLQIEGNVSLITGE